MEALLLVFFIGLGLLVGFLALDCWFKSWSQAPRHRDTLRRWRLR
ncbi:Uncharacterised protein [uncultured archaeon]|nr:Uncharacterised protein [uncultured archaeon]